jgi:hypothetical protein
MGLSNIGHGVHDSVFLEGVVTICVEVSKKEMRKLARSGDRRVNQT